MQRRRVADDLDLAVGKADRIQRRGGIAVQPVLARCTGNVLSAGRLHRIAALHRCDGESILRIITGDLALGDRNIDLVPLDIKIRAGTVHDQAVALRDDQIGTRPVLRRGRDLGVGLGLALCKNGGGQDGKYHRHCQQKRKPARAAFVHLQNLLLFLVKIRMTGAS